MLLFAMSPASRGRSFRFARALQVDPKGELSVSFKVGQGNIAKVFGALVSALVVFMGLWGMMARPH